MAMSFLIAAAQWRKDGPAGVGSTHHSNQWNNRNYPLSVRVVSVHDEDRMNVSRYQLSWGLLLPALIVPTVGALFYFMLFPDGAVGKSAYTLTKFFILCYPLLLLWRAGPRGIIGRERGIQWPEWRSVWWVGFLSGVSIASIGFILMWTPVGGMIWEAAPRVAERAEGLGFKDHFLLFAIFVSVIHSGLEEFYWRWFVYGQLRGKTSRWRAHLLGAGAFGGHHLVVTLQFFPVLLALALTACVIVGGVIWSMMYERQGTLAGCWLSHLFVDIMLMVIGYQLLTMG